MCHKLYKDTKLKPRDCLGIEISAMHRNSLGRRLTQAGVDRRMVERFNRG